MIGVDVADEFGQFDGVVTLKMDMQPLKSKKLRGSRCVLIELPMER